MTTKHYVNDLGAYIGGFGDGAVPPKGAIEVANPPQNSDQFLLGGKWQSYAPSKEAQEAKRQAAFVVEADPLFFQWQAGESTEKEWLAKRQEVRDRYPYPTE